MRHEIKRHDLCAYVVGNCLSECPNNGSSIQHNQSRRFDYDCSSKANSSRYIYKSRAVLLVRDRKFEQAILSRAKPGRMNGVIVRMKSRE
jgi:hypothetical protein